MFLNDLKNWAEEKNYSVTAKKTGDNYTITVGTGKKQYPVVFTGNEIDQADKYPQIAIKRIENVVNKKKT